MGRGVLVAGAVLLIAAACGSDGETVTSASDPPDAGSTSAPPAETSDWCDEFDALEDPSDLEDVDLEEVPDEIRAPVEELVDSDDVRADLEAGTLEPGAFTGLMGAFSEVTTWGHEHCGADDPFCGAWIGVNAVIAEYALAGEEEAILDLETYLSEVEPVLTDYVPSDLQDELETALAFIREPSDDGERAAEAAHDALDGWTRTEGCEGAPSPPDEG